MNKTLPRIFVGASLRSVASSGFNLLGTVMVVRWFGAGTYADYIVDLAMISVLLVVLEAVPSSYSVFRIQDDPSWQRSVAAQVIATALLAALIVFSAGHWGRLLRADSPWMVVYAITLAVKRYLDIRLQSLGRLSEFLGIELATSALRLVLLGFCFHKGVEANESVWASLAIAALCSQCLWLLNNPAELRAFGGFVDLNAWRALAGNFRSYIPYYYGIALKRLKDNFVPLVAERLFVSRELLAAFLLAYRGVIFAAGQVRIIEAMMNHRGALAAALKMSSLHRYVVAMAAQALCLSLSAGLLIASGVHSLPWMPVFVLSLIVWPIVFMVLERAQAYSSFQVNRVNGSVFAYLAVALLGALILRYAATDSVTALAWLLIAAELASLQVLRATRRSCDAKVG